MKPSLLNKHIDTESTYLITTTGGRKLTAKAIFGEDELGPKFFQNQQI